MKKITLLILVFTSINAFSQSFNEDKVNLTNFLKRMYMSSLYEGVKIVDDYDNQYLISVIGLEKSKFTSESAMNRVAQVKAQSQANTFINGAQIDMEMIVKTSEFKDQKNNTTSIVETVEVIKQNASGFTQGLELLTNFESEDSKKEIYIFARKLEK